MSKLNDEKEKEFEEISQDNLKVAEKIKDRKFINGVEHYLVKWKGFNKKFNTWEPIQNLIGYRCSCLIKKFLNRKHDGGIKGLKKNTGSRDCNTNKCKEKRQLIKSTFFLKNDSESSVNNQASMESFSEDYEKEDESAQIISCSSKNLNFQTEEHFEEEEVLGNFMTNEEKRDEENKSLLKKEEEKEKLKALYLKAKASNQDYLPIEIVSLARKEDNLVYLITFPVRKEDGLVIYPTEVVPTELLKLMCPNTLIDFLEAFIHPKKKIIKIN